MHSTALIHTVHRFWTILNSVFAQDVVAQHLNFPEAVCHDVSYQHIWKWQYFHSYSAVVLVAVLFLLPNWLHRKLPVMLTISMWSRTIKLNFLSNALTLRCNRGWCNFKKKKTPSGSQVTTCCCQCSHSAHRRFWNHIFLSLTPPISFYRLEKVVTDVPASSSSCWQNSALNIYLFHYIYIQSRAALNIILVYVQVDFFSFPPCLF